MNKLLFAMARWSVSLIWADVFFFNATATTEIYTSIDTLSLHDALPIYLKYHFELAVAVADPSCDVRPATGGAVGWEAVQRGGGGVVGQAGPLEADAPVW